MSHSVGMVILACFWGLVLGAGGVIAVDLFRLDSRLATISVLMAVFVVGVARVLR